MSGHLPFTGAPGTELPAAGAAEPQPALSRVEGPPQVLRAEPEGLTDRRRLSLVGHLEEVRRRLWVVLLGIGATSAISFTWAGRVVEWLLRPAGKALPTLAFFSPAEAMVAYLKVAIAVGILVCMPLLLYEGWAFVSPGLTVRERRYGLAFVSWGSALFFAGAAFAYWGVLPPALAFLLRFGSGQLVPVISVSHYLTFTSMVLLVCGVIFELPLGVWCLARVGIVHPKVLRRNWRQAVVGMVVASALLTPTPDVATLLLLLAPMLVLYEVSVWVAGLAVRQRGRHG